MATVSAQLNDYRQSPRKVRLLADAVRGKTALRAIEELPFVAKRAAPAIGKLIASAVANAKARNLDTETLVIKDITVDKGATLFRRQPMSRGRAFVIRKRTSHIKVTLAEPTELPPKKSAKKAASKTK
jgi:large subunit ribosomal protein L22